MPDLPDELRALLHERAEDAPAVPSPTDRLVRTVRRRQAVRASLAAGGVTLGVVAIVALAAAAVRPDARVAPPAANTTPTPTPLTDSKYEFCTGPVYQDVMVSVHPTELKFQYGCYRVALGGQRFTLVNDTGVAHDLVIAAEGGQPFYKTQTIKSGHWGGMLPQPLSPGDYSLTCSIHPSMHAQLVVR